MNQSSGEIRKRFNPLSIAGKALLVGAAVYAAKKLASRKLPLEPGPAERGLGNKIVLITGGSRGLGLALAFEFGERGCRLALAARDEAELYEACRRLAEKNIEATPFVADLANRSEAEALIQRVIQHFGSLDVLVNDAGLIQVAPLDSVTHQDFESAMDLMFWAPVNLSLTVLPHMTRQGAGQIVNITSIGGRVSVPHLLPYSCAKFACFGFSTGLAAEVKSRGVHVLTVAPGLMRTGSYLNAKFGGQPKDEFTWFALLGNLPMLSISATNAARDIVNALEERKHTLTLSVPAKMLVAAETLLPEANRRLMSYVNMLLPKAKGSSEKLAGQDLNPEFDKAFQSFMKLGREAARNFNE